MKALLCFLAACLVVHYGHGMSEKQMKSATKLVRNACQPKTKVTDAQIDDMHKGTWSEEQNVKCYMNCVLNMFKVGTKEGGLEIDAILKQVSSLPEKYQEVTANTMNTCKSKEVLVDDKCQNSWNVCKCIYFESPENYFLP